MAASDRTTETCSACSRLVDIVLSDGGLRIKVDPGHHEDGTVVVRALPDGTVRARILPGDELPHPGGARRDHRRTCPRSAHAVRRRHASTATCISCRTALDPVLEALGGWYRRWHPCCAPAPTPRPAAAGPEQQELIA